MEALLGGSIELMVTILDQGWHFGLNHSVGPKI